LVSFSAGLLKYLFNVRIRNTNEPFSMVDLEHFLQQNSEQGESTQELNRELLQNALSLPAVRIRQCLVPRTEIEAIEINTSLADLRKKFEETKLSKIIVYEGNIDNILGYVHQLGLFKKPEYVKSIILPIPVVPESMSATDLINKFSRERRSIAWVIDEFGGTAGIITMEDVLEEIFGDIKDEYDIEEFVEKQISENEYIFFWSSLNWIILMKNMILSFLKANTRLYQAISSANTKRSLSQKSASLLTNMSLMF
jgi:CBS domain containing-hemolysin-like protein